MSTSYDAVASGIRRLELELVVRDLITVLNEGCVRDLVPFLDEALIYRASASHTVKGLRAVLAMIADINSTFVVRHTTVDWLAVDDSTVLAQQTIALALRGSPTQTVLGFASYRFRGLQVVEWTQTHS
ncbi:nuclear transport factor 2 family protein [Microbacterium timonense]|uniref:nuclear transport factor 2 family protein n=1 Tax=Microbacterium timonense TaxID=2086576 RepID=UPI000D0EB73B|nr:nuclear transport factor 2 family protein [Microbacterium timonense]